MASRSDLAEVWLPFRGAIWLLSCAWDSKRIGKHDLAADGFCLKQFFAAEAASTVSGSEKRASRGSCAAFLNIAAQAVKVACRMIGKFDAISHGPRSRRYSSMVIARPSRMS